MDAYKFEKFIKIRIGEPLTALDLNKCLHYLPFSVFYKNYQKMD